MTTTTIERPTATHHAQVEVGGRAVRRTVHRVWRGVTGLVLIVVAGAAIAGMVTVIHEHLGFSPVLSPSMVPTFQPGDLLITRPEAAAAIKVGQIIALPVPGAPGQRYVHRIISVRMDHGDPVVRTKGDANPAPEPGALRITSAQVPQVVETVPNLGRLALVIRGGGLRLAIIIVTALLALVAAKRLFMQAIGHSSTGVDDTEDTS